MLEPQDSALPTAPAVQSAPETKPSQAEPPVHGVLLLDKPKGLSSHTAMRQAARCLGDVRCGHGGTLDPLADGLLVVMLGAATKFSEWSLHADKQYRALVQLGVTTSTDDAEGEVLTRQPLSPTALTRAAIEAALPALVGELEQRPPRFSAVKIAGRKLYDYARANEAIEAPARRVQVHSLELDWFEGEQLQLTIHCGRGTYIRSLARDLGEALGCGAHLAGLTRLASGNFKLEQACTLSHWQELDDASRRARLLVPDTLLAHLPLWTAPASMLARILSGQALSTRELQTLTPLTQQTLARLYVREAHTPQARFAGLYRVASEVLIAQRLLSAPEFHACAPTSLPH